jgi:UDP-glucose:(heptosyl)LPS alpha-1,3-glucosyltransferase
MHVVLLKSRARNRGGLEKAASRIASAFVERGAKVSILTTGSAEGLQFRPEISVYPTQLISWPAFFRMEQFDRYVQEWLKKNPANLVFGMDRNRFQTHIRAGNGVHDAYLKSRILTEGKFKYYTCLLNPMHRKILQMEKASFEYPQLKKLFTNSRMVRDQILERFATDPAKIQVIHNGVEWHEMEKDFHSWPLQKEASCKALNLDPHLFQFLFIGNGYLRKGLVQLLHALARVKRRDFQLSVIGKDNQVKRYEALSLSLGLGKKVRFFGHRADIRTFYQIADVLTIPSFYDPFANVTVEALAMGLYVLSSKHNGGSEILTSANGDVIPDLLNVEAFAHSLESAMRRKKTIQSAHLARQSVAHLDFSNQMHSLMEACYG